VSVIANGLKRQRLPLLAIMSAVVMAGLVWLSLAETRTPSPSTTDGSVAAPGIKQPDWKLNVSVEGRLGKLTAADKAAFNKARPQVVALIQDLYDSIFLNTGSVDELVATTFSREAAASLEETKLGLPSEAIDVRIIRRAAAIGLEAKGSRHAAAQVTVIAKGAVDGTTVRVRHASTLWLERTGRGWKVIAFEVNQGPLK
jgi:hypothetical protein